MATTADITRRARVKLQEVVPDFFENAEITQFITDGYEFFEKRYANALYAGLKSRTPIYYERNTTVLNLDKTVQYVAIPTDKNGNAITPGMIEFVEIYDPLFSTWLPIERYTTDSQYLRLPAPNGISNTTIRIIWWDFKAVFFASLTDLPVELEEALVLYVLARCLQLKVHGAGQRGVPVDIGNQAEGAMSQALSLFHSAVPTIEPPQEETYGNRRSYERPRSR